VLNDLFAREILKRRDVESFLGSSMAVELPYDPFLYLKAVNEGVPIVSGAPKSIPAERLTKLSTLAFGGGPSLAIPELAESKRSGGLFRRRR
jgi:Flp pilus assembly CpaE family ATPase